MVTLRHLDMNVNIIDPTIDDRWDDFVYGRERSTIFHTSAWARVIQEAYHYEPRYHVLVNEDGQIIAAIPLFFIRSKLTGNRLVCLPFSDYCYPLGDNAKHISLLLSSVKKEVMVGAASYLEVRGLQNTITPTQLDLRARNYHVLYMLSLNLGADALKERLHHSIKRGIHQAEERGVKCRITCNEDDIDRFYKLNVDTRKKLGVLPQPHAFFKSLFHNVISQNLGFIMLAECDGKVIAGIIFLTHKDTIYYKYNASDEKYLRKRPNHLATWQTIQYACANNYKHFDFGRCAPEEEGLRIYKSRWGAKEVELPYYYYPQVKGFAVVAEDSLRYRAMKFFSHIVPQSAFKVAGSIMYKHLG